MMCEVVDVIKRSPYPLQDSGFSDIAFVIAIGGRKAPKAAKLTEISNSRITESELSEYLK